MITNLAKLSDGQIAAVNLAIDKRNTVIHFIKSTLRLGIDYGTIPGCGKKLDLFLPGAEKLCELYQLRAHLSLEQSIEDWGGEKTSGEPFFFYKYRCELWSRDNQKVAECFGSCNSFEDKYRWVTQSKKCPNCDAEAIKRSRYAPRGGGEKGWYCHDKSGGCGSQFAADDQRITQQTTGRVKNPRVFDCVNTIDKMAQKRALVGATKLVTGVSNFFGDDVEIMNAIDVAYEPTEDIHDAQVLHPVSVSQAPNPQPSQGEINRDRIRAIGKLVGLEHRYRSEAHGIQEIKGSSKQESDITQRS
jgi:transposase-like protein